MPDERERDGKLFYCVNCGHDVCGNALPYVTNVRPPSELEDSDRPVIISVAVIVSCATCKKPLGEWSGDCS